MKPILPAFLGLFATLCAFPAHALDPEWYRSVAPVSGNYYVRLNPDTDQEERGFIGLRPASEQYCEPVASGGCLYRIRYDLTKPVKGVFRRGAREFKEIVSYSEIALLGNNPGQIELRRSFLGYIFEAKLARSGPDTYTGEWSGGGKKGEEIWQRLYPRVNRISASETPFGIYSDAPDKRYETDVVIPVIMKSRKDYNWLSSEKKRDFTPTGQPKFRIYLYGENLEGPQHISFPDAVDYEAHPPQAILAEPDHNGRRKMKGILFDTVMWSNARPGPVRLQVNDRIYQLDIRMSDAGEKDTRTAVISTIREGDAEVPARLKELEEAVIEAQQQLELAEGTVDLFRKAALQEQAHWQAEFTEANAEMAALETEITAAEAQDGRASDALLAQRLELAGKLRLLPRRAETDWNTYLANTAHHFRAVEEARAKLVAAKKALFEARQTAGYGVIGVQTEFSTFHKASAEDVAALNREIDRITQEIDDRIARRPELERARAEALEDLRRQIEQAEEANHRLLLAGFSSLAGQFGIEAAASAGEALSVWATGGPYAGLTEVLRQGVANQMSGVSYYDYHGPLIPRDGEESSQAQVIGDGEDWLLNEAAREAGRIPLHQLRLAIAAKDRSAAARLAAALKPPKSGSSRATPIDRFVAATRKSAAARDAWKAAIGKNGISALAKSLVSKVGENILASAAKETAKLGAAILTESEFFEQYLEAQLEVAAAVAALQAAGDEYWENEDFITGARGIQAGYLERFIEGGWITDRNAEFAPENGLTIELTLSGAVAPTDFAAELSLSGVDLVRQSPDRLVWFLPKGSKAFGTNAHSLVLRIDRQ
ncbi:hypothetical protein [uncultured Roseibium sp.]|uniref:hypothetical protein n=1 Tax=uncultured Roseibium sp. TaxID=1936171 RepID=UPI00321626A8